MPVRRAVAAVVVLAGLVAFLYYYEFKGETARQEAQEERTRALSFVNEAIERVRLDRQGGTTIEIIRQGGAWHLASPLATRADDRIVEGMLNDLKSLKIERTLEGVETAERGTFGLEEPAARVVLSVGHDGGSVGSEEAEDDAMALDIGGPVPVSGGRYAARPGQEGVLLVAGNLTTILEATADRLRQKKVIGMDSWNIRKVAMKSQDGSVMLEKTGDSWRLTGPVTVPADGARVESILSSLTSAEAAGFAEEKPSYEQLSSFGLTPEAGAIDLEVTGEDGAVHAVLGRSGAEESTWAKRSDMDAVMSIGASLRESVASALAEPESLRDPRPARFNRFALSGLTIVEESGAKRTRDLFKDATSSWHLGSEEGAAIPAERVNAILDALEMLVADRWETSEKTSTQEALSIAFKEHAPAGGETAAQPLSLTVGVPGDSDGTAAPGIRESTIGSSLASVRYVVPGSGVVKLLEAVAQLEEPVAAVADAAQPPAGGTVPPRTDDGKGEKP